MAQATFHFPRGFLWGAATASHQVEGNNTNNNWWAWEQQAGRIKQGQKSGQACGWWSGRWREDFDRAAEAGQNAHRFSIEWSRVQPLPDKWDESSLDRYREMARGLAERGMTPMVTLHHFSDPLWLAEMGGWENEQAVEYFIPYVRKVVDALREYVTLWVTINEPNVLTISAYLMGDFPPGKSDMGAALRVMTNLARAHAAAYHAIHEVQKEARAGLSMHYRGFLPARSWSPLDRWAASMQSKVFNDFFPRAAQSGVLHFPAWRKRLAEAKGTQDFLGVNYYTQDLVSFNLLKPGDLFAHRFFPPSAELSETGFIANLPQGMAQALKWGRKFGAPIIITENGVEDSQDTLRPRYLIQHLHQVWRAINSNCPVKGYFHWSLVDNFEWERGWTQRFGLWGLDPDTQARIRRPSVDLYAEICKQNGISSETVARYAPEIFEGMFPN
ncbi:MAG: glycoside hydrolase family 1 protein [Anaerolineales bacterium]|nr:glycoside hydrolase family 1 protein [Anaerolineales bacterium]